MPEPVPMKIIATMHSSFPAKFGIPRQSGLVEALEGRIVLEPEYRQKEAFREIEGFSHLWLIWQFSAADDSWRATVRPPRLGGNARVGVFASRSPFRPNRLGLSCVRLIRVEYDAPDGPAVVVGGADLLDGTPIYDIKPYIPVADCHPEAAQGYTAQTRVYALSVEIPAALLEKIPPEKRDALQGVLAGDPRPGYAEDPDREYGLQFAGMEIGFRVAGGVLTVTRVEG